MYFDLPKSIKGDVKFFTNPSTVTNVQWSTYQVPSWANFINILCIGGGAGSGGGFTRTAGTAGGGGGTGGSSAVTRVTVPAMFLPSTLFIQVGAGGKGVASGGGTAGSGVLSYVSIAPNITATNVLAVSGNAAPVGGGTGTAAAVGALGAAGTVATIANMPLAGMGHFDVVAGVAGVAGGAVAGGNGTQNGIPTSSCITTAGTAGAGTTSADFAGGQWIAITDSFLSQNRPATPAAGSNNGSGGFPMWKPMFFWAGTGGSSSNTGVGGNGGNGSFGCSGGGGGAGTTGGRGGDGGDGIVIITAM